VSVINSIERSEMGAGDGEDGCTPPSKGDGTRTKGSSDVVRKARRMTYKMTDLHIIFLWYGIRVCSI